MESFKLFIEQQEFVDLILNEFNQASAMQSPGKPWSAKKPEILQMWRNIRPNMPIIMTPIVPKGGEEGSSSYGEDGIRISGSQNFIAGVLARLKELLGYENPHTKLRLVFRGVESKDGSFQPDKQSFVFYVNAEQRGQRKQKKLEVPSIT